MVKAENNANTPDEGQVGESSQELLTQIRDSVVKSLTRCVLGSRNETL